MSNENKDRDLKRPVYDRYNEISDWYNKVRTDPEMEKPYLEKIVSSIPKNAHILDIGCGSGVPISEYFIKKGYKITGIDGSIKLLSAARSKFPEMEWIQQDIRDLKLSLKYDAIVDWGVIFHLTEEEQRKVFSVLSKHLKPDALFLFTTGDEKNEDGGHWGEMQGVAFPHFSLDPDEYQLMLKQLNFDVVEMNIKDPNCGEQSVWIVRKLK